MSVFGTLSLLKWADLKNVPRGVMYCEMSLPGMPQPFISK